MLRNAANLLGLSKAAQSSLASKQASLYSTIPVIDVSQLLNNGPGKQEVAKQIDSACRKSGFFYIKNYGIKHSLETRMEQLSRTFFSHSLEKKLSISMDLGGKSYRGYFPVGAELTGGKPDVKEGIYFGTELDKNHPMVRSNMPLHGWNLFPSFLPEFKPAVLEYMKLTTIIGQKLMSGIALGLGLKEDHFSDIVSDPMVLFMMFNYPAVKDTVKEGSWGVGEHTDYGTLTILKQDNLGGLQIQNEETKEWIDAPPIPNTLICNIGDMMDNMTGGMYKSTMHRVRSPRKNVDRISFPVFFGPNFNAVIKPLSGCTRRRTDEQRWDNINIHEFKGPYGDYLLGKVSRVFPKLKDVLYEGYVPRADLPENGNRM